MSIGALPTREEDDILTPDEAGRLLGVSGWTVRQWARDRKIPAAKLGKFWKFRRSSLMAWVAEQERAAR